MKKIGLAVFVGLIVGINAFALENYSCFVGSPVQTLTVQANDTDSAISIAKQICKAAAPSGFAQNCDFAYSQCTDQGPALPSFTCLVGSPVQVLTVQAADQASALSIARQICMQTAPAGWQNNCLYADSSCDQQ